MTKVCAVDLCRVPGGENGRAKSWGRERAKGGFLTQGFRSTIIFSRGLLLRHARRT